MVATGDVRSSWEGQPTWIEAASLPQRTNVWLHEELQAYLSGASSLQLSRGKLHHPVYKPV